MTQKAVVVLENGRLMAEVVRHEACQSCRACKFGQEARVLVELPVGGREYAPGEEIELNLPDGMVGKASLIAYALPLALLLAGLFAGSLLGGEGAQALGAAIGLALGLLLIKLLEPRLARFAPAPCAKDKQQEKQGG